ncbi:hypothetical protein I8H89_00270 [Candidatus Saccharibacteria bacterium]|nr:hypothetical protein [Candidatus Saccharibacteria bacterium]
MDNKDIVIRAAKTFAQAFFATLAAGAIGVTDVNTLKALLIAALAAGISAAWNLLIGSGR